MTKRIGIILMGLLLNACNNAVENDTLHVGNDALVRQQTEILRVAIGELEQQMIDAGLIDVGSLHQNIVINLRYSTTDNLWKTDLYGGLHKAYLHKDAARKLLYAQQLLDGVKPGYRIVVWDAARPLSVQQQMWDQIDVPLNIRHWYVANPARGSIHNYGMAVDITIMDSEGNYLDMGTDFDHFGHPAYTGNEENYCRTGQLSREQTDNRLLLKNLMFKAGFTVSTTEWWHYNASSLAWAKQHCTRIE